MVNSKYQSLPKVDGNTPTPDTSRDLSLNFLHFLSFKLNPFGYFFLVRIGIRVYIRGKRQLWLYRSHTTPSNTSARSVFDVRCRLDPVSTNKSKEMGVWFNPTYQQTLQDI